MEKADLLKMISFNYSKPKAPESVHSSASSIDDFDMDGGTFSTIMNEETEQAMIRKSISHLSDLIDFDQTDAKLFMERTKLHLRSGRSDLALEDAKSAISLNHTSIDAFILLGKSLSRLSRFGESEMAFKRALELVHKSAEKEKKEIGSFEKKEERKERKEERILLIDRELRHLRYNTLHAMNFDPILSLKVASKSQSITDAIQRVTHAYDPVVSLPKLQEPIGKNSSAWGTNGSASFASKLRSYSVGRESSGTGTPASSVASSSGFPTPSPSPPVAPTTTSGISPPGFGWNKPVTLTNGVTSFSQVITRKKEENAKKEEKKSGWQVVGKKKETLKSPESTGSSEKTTGNAELWPQPGKVEAWPKPGRSPDSSHNHVSMADILKELKVISKQHKSKESIKGIKTGNGSMRTGNGSGTGNGVNGTPKSIRSTNLFKFQGVWVGGINPKCPLPELMGIFGKFGKIVSINHLKNNGANCVFVNYNNEAAPLDAFSELNGKLCPAIAMYPRNFLQVRLAPTDHQMAFYSNLTGERALKIVTEAGECYGWRNSEGCPDFNSCKLSHKPENKEIDSRPWIKLQKMKEENRTRI